MNVATRYGNLYDRSRLLRRDKSFFFWGGGGSCRYCYSAHWSEKPANVQNMQAISFYFEKMLVLESTLNIFVDLQAVELQPYRCCVFIDIFSRTPPAYIYITNHFSLPCFSRVVSSTVDGNIWLARRTCAITHDCPGDVNVCRGSSRYCYLEHWI